MLRALPFLFCPLALHACILGFAFQASCLRFRFCLSGSIVCLTVLPFMLHTCCCPLVFLWSTCASATLPSQPCLFGLLPENSMYCALPMVSMLRRHVSCTSTSAALVAVLLSVRKMMQGPVICVQNTGLLWRHLGKTEAEPRTYC